MADDDASRLAKMMRLRGAWLPQPPTPEARSDLAAAERRCAECRSKELCDEVLEAGRSQGYTLFCPNAHYIERLRSKTLSF